MGEIIEDGLKAIGIDPVMTTLDWDGMYAALGTFDYDLIVLSINWTPEPNMPLGMFTCAQVGGWNFPGYCNSEYDELYSLQSQESDPAARKQMVWDLQQMIFDDKPYIMLINNKRVDAYRSDNFINFGTNSGYLLWEMALMQGEPVQ
jgi:peptide/nickel transport system substrate-binding protein